MYRYTVHKGRTKNFQMNYERTEKSVSGSNKKNETSASPEEAMKKQRSQRQEAEEKRKETINTVIGACVGVVVLGLVLWNQGLFQNDTAFTIDGKSFTYQEVQLKYTDSLYSALMGEYTPEEGGTAYDMSTPSEEQMYSSTETWHDLFSKEACKGIANDYAVYQIAQADGFTLPQEGLDYMESLKSQMDTIWVGKTTSKAGYFSGLGVSEADYLFLEEISLVSSYYQNHIFDSLEHSEEEREEYYQENKGSLDVLNYSQIQYLFTLPVEYDEDGEELELSEEDQIFYEGTKSLVSMSADNALEAIENGMDHEEVVTEFSQYLANSDLHIELPTSTLTQEDAVTAWLMDEARQVGDVGKIEEVVDNNTIYSVLVFEGRDRAEALTANIRHILVPTVSLAEVAEGEEAPELTEEDWTASEESAQAVLDLWLEAGSDPEYFGELAGEHSADTATAAYGGILNTVTHFDQYDQDLLDWVFDDSRETGDYTMIRDENSTDGWQILYFDSWDESIWELSTIYSLGSSKMTQWLEDNTGNVSSGIVYTDKLSNVYAASLFG